MVQAQATESGSFQPYTRQAGDEPLPGYRLLAPLGRGGFGEVWKCEAPGGLHKAIKFVTSESEDGRGDERFGQELAAFEQIKAIRHPFLLTLERVEQIDGSLIMVMELADRQLQDRYRECRTNGLPGIPRDELLGYFADAAEALDVISTKFNLQHLDVKPANLFLVSGHVKVGDYGLVAQLEGPDAGNRGLTPRYVAPEVLRGTPSNRSDQYSLALVYQELLTGDYPYTGKTTPQLMLQHVSAQPNLTSLPRPDRIAVAKALSKQPEDRYPSCLAFVQALMSSGINTAMLNVSMNIRRASVNRSVAEMNLPVTPVRPDESPSNDSSIPDGTYATQMGPSARARRDDTNHHSTLGSEAYPTMPAALRSSSLPPLITASKPLVLPGSRPSSSGVPVPPPRPVPPAEPPERIAKEILESGLVVLKSLRPVMPVSILQGLESNEEPHDPHAFAGAVVCAAIGGGFVPNIPGEAARLRDGAWVCKFASSVPGSVIPLKLAVVNERWEMTVEHPLPGKLVLTRVVHESGYFRAKKRYGLEVAIAYPMNGRGVGEVTVTCRLFGEADPKFARDALDLMPKLLTDIQKQLGEEQDRHKHTRVTCTYPITLYPIHRDRGVEPPVQAKCRNVSIGGLCFATETRLPTMHVYAAFPDVAPTAGHAILVRLIRVETINGESVYGAQYRTKV